jgi:peptide deformylase
MKAIREAEWSGLGGSPQVKVSPHPMNGLGL